MILFTEDAPSEHKSPTNILRPPLQNFLRSYMEIMLLNMQRDWAVLCEFSCLLWNMVRKHIFAGMFTPPTRLHGVITQQVRTGVAFGGYHRVFTWRISDHDMKLATYINTGRSSRTPGTPIRFMACLSLNILYILT
jgi:hypothetical protein